MRILLVEDEIALSRALVRILKHANYSVDAVYDGQTALDYLYSEIYDVVLLDIMLPKKDGLSVLREIREKNGNISVILLTSKSEIEDKITGLDAGADDYVTKPIEMQELLARIRAVARRRGELKENVLSFANLKLNRNSYEIWVDGKCERLGHKEFQMLEMLMMNPTGVVSTERFMDKIWGYDSEASVGVVWVYLSSIRKKLEGLNAKVKIKASRGLGYFLEEEHD